MNPLVILAVALTFAACQPLTTGSHGPVTTTARHTVVQFPGSDVTLTGEVFRPTSQAMTQPRHPAIVLLHGCGGLYTRGGQLTERHHEWAQRFAAWGFVVVLVDSLGPRGLGPLCNLERRPIQPWQERTADAYAALDYLIARPDVDQTKVFVMGWSHGGSTVMGVVRRKAPGLRATGPQFKAAIAYYPGCEQPLRTASYRPAIPLLIQHGEADDWTPAAACVELATTLHQTGATVEIILYPEAHHGFDAPKSAVRFLPNVYNRRAPNQRGAHVGTHEPSRLQAIADTKRFIEHQLTRSNP